MIIELELPEGAVPDFVPRAPAQKGFFDTLTSAAREMLGLGGGNDLTQGFGGFLRSSEAKTESISLEQAPELSPSELSDYQQEIHKINRELAKNINQPELWNRQAKIADLMGVPLSGLVSRLTAAIIGGNNKAFFRITLDYSRWDRDLKALLVENLPAAQKGTLLAAIRERGREAEHHYALNLAYSTQFADAHIFRQAVDSMRTGYMGEKRKFHQLLAGKQVSASSTDAVNKIQLLGAKDIGRIKQNVSHFCGQIGSIQQAILIFRQFETLLIAHLGPVKGKGLVKSMDLKILSTLNYDSRLMDKKWEDLLAYPNLPNPSRRLESTVRWYDLLTMEKLKDLSLEEMFLGYLYRPVIKFDRNSGETKTELDRVRWLRDLPESVFPALSDGKPLAQVIYDRYSAGYTDWSDYFTKGGGWMDSRNPRFRARCHRLLLFLVNNYGPLKDFQRFIEPMKYELEKNVQWDIYYLTLFCDLFRLNLAYQKKFDEQRLFILLFRHLPEPPTGWSDFQNAAEQIILCLFMNSSPKRSTQLDEMLTRTLKWLAYALDNRDEAMLDGALTIMSYLEIGVLTDLLPETIEQHQFLERRRALWLEHARSLAGGGDAGWKKWITTCRS